jgi:pimeloyl-ACP methyl ester carboxylesterase
MANTNMSPDVRFDGSSIFRAEILIAALFIFSAFSPRFFAAETDLPKSEEVTLPTSDNVQIAATYYRGTKGKESIPVVLLHGYGQKHNRTDYTKGLAPFLQSKGFAVLAVDLRGHGDSTRMRTLRGKDLALDAASLSPGQFTLMITNDMRAVKRFLWEKNNAGELNLDKLCLIGSEMGASIAVEFAWLDAVEQEANPVLRPEYKLGQFVKALVLLSPEISFKGISMSHAMQNPAVRKDISVLILVGGNETSALNEANRVYALFEREHPKPDPDKKDEQQDIFKPTLDTKLQGTNLLREKNLKVEEIIAAFLELRLVKSDPSRTWLWKERKMPYQ